MIPLYAKYRVTSKNEIVNKIHNLLDTNSRLYVLILFSMDDYHIKLPTFYLQKPIWDAILKKSPKPDFVNEYAIIFKLMPQMTNSDAIWNPAWLLECSHSQFRSIPEEEDAFLRHPNEHFNNETGFLAIFSNLPDIGFCGNKAELD